MDNPTVRIKYTPGEIVESETEEIEVSEETSEETSEEVSVKKPRKKSKK